MSVKENDLDKSFLEILDIQDKEDRNWYHKLPDLYKDKLNNKTIYTLDQREQKLLEAVKKGDITLKTFYNYYQLREHYQINDDLTISRKSSLLSIFLDSPVTIITCILWLTSLAIIILIQSTSATIPALQTQLESAYTTALLGLNGPFFLILSCFILMKTVYSINDLILIKKLDSYINNHFKN